jgi:hypothetical protein
VNNREFNQLALLTATDLADAIDPAHNDAERIAAVFRLLHRDPEMAVSLACSLLHGFLTEFEELAPGRSQHAMRRLRANIAQMPE